MAKVNILLRTPAGELERMHVCDNDEEAIGLAIIELVKSARFFRVGDTIEIVEDQ